MSRMSGWTNIQSVSYKCHLTFLHIWIVCNEVYCPTSSPLPSRRAALPPLYPVGIHTAQTKIGHWQPRVLTSHQHRVIFQYPPSLSLLIQNTDQYYLSLPCLPYFPYLTLPKNQDDQQIRLRPRPRDQGKTFSGRFKSASASASESESKSSKRLGTGF